MCGLYSNDKHLTFKFICRSDTCLILKNNKTIEYFGQSSIHINQLNFYLTFQLNQ
jgi:hypothetical protein